MGEEREKTSASHEFPPPASVQGLAVVHGGRRIRLKWHRLRRRRADPLFSAAVMAEGFRLGASMELDLRVRRDGGFVVLHDATLERETTGTGPVVEAAITDLRKVQYRDGAARALILTEDLVALLSAAHPDAVLQFDMKDDLAAIGAAGLDHLADHFAATPCRIIVGAADLALIVAVGERLPNLQRGIDPSDKLAALYRGAGPEAVAAALVAELEGPTKPQMAYLAFQLILRAERDGLDLVDLCHAAGVEVDAWTFTLKEPAGGFSDAEWQAFSRLLALKVDQISTDEALATEAAYHKRMAR